MDARTDGGWKARYDPTRKSRLARLRERWVRLLAPYRGTPGPQRSDRPPPLLASLRLLAELRMLAVGGQTAAIVAAVQFGVTLRWPLMASVVGVLVLANLLVWVRLRRGGPATFGEIGAHLVFDLCAFATLLLAAGGTANPFALLFVLHAVLFALLLPWTLAIPGVALVVAALTGATVWRSPLVMHDGSPLPASLHSLGDWTGLALTVLVTAWIVARIVASLRRQQRELSDAERRMGRNEMVMRVGVLAAGAAHELATPMMTMSVVASEMEQENDVAALKRDAGILKAQIAACRHTLDNLLAAASHARAQPGERIRVDRLLESAAHRFGALRPDAELSCSWNGDLPVPGIVFDAALAQAILILLNNAADASVHDVQMIGNWDFRTLRVTVRDRGPGLPAEVHERLGREFFTTKPRGEGTGLGLVLAADAARRLGGSLRWANRQGGGTEVELQVPLDAPEESPS